MHNPSSHFLPLKTVLAQQVDRCHAVIERLTCPTTEQ